MCIHLAPLYNGRSVGANKALLCMTRVSGISASTTGECSGGDNPTDTQDNDALTFSLNGHEVLYVVRI